MELGFYFLFLQEQIKDIIIYERKRGKFFVNQMAGTRDLIIDVSLRHEFHGSCLNHMRNGEASHADANGEFDAAVKAKLDNYQHDYNERNFFFLPAVMTTSRRISGDFLRLLYILSNRQADNYLRMGLLDPSTKAFKQCRGVLLLQPCCHRARLRPGHRHEDRHRPTQTPKTLTTSPTFTASTSLHTPSTTSNIRLVDNRSYYRWGNSQLPPSILST